MVAQMNKRLLQEELDKMCELSGIEETEKQEAYKKFFNEKLKEFGVDSPGELDDKKKKEFFNAVQDGWDDGKETK
jgi:hypothetical protein